MNITMTPKTRLALRALHSISVCGWIGGGLAILILLKLAGLSTITGLILSAGKPWGFRGHRWITEKCAITTVLLVFGALWLAPGLQSLTPRDSLEWCVDAVYRRAWLWGAIAATLQTTILLLVVWLSIVKPEKNKIT